jgi:hypothetical protein
VYDYLEYMAAAKGACDAFGVPMIDSNAYNFAAFGGMADAIHPNSAGQERYFELIVDALANAIETFEGPLHPMGSKHLGGHVYAWSTGALTKSGATQGGLAIGAFRSGTSWIATATEATIFEDNAGNHNVYHNSGLTIGSTFSPTLSAALNSLGQWTFQSNTQIVGNALLLGDVLLGATSNVLVRSGTGSPEGVVTAGKGSVFHRTDGGVGSTLYYKGSGSGNTGWTAIA